LVDLKKLTYQNDPFIMAEQAKQIFYVQDPCDERWSVVLHGKIIGVNVEDDDSLIDTYVSPLSTKSCLTSSEKKLTTFMQIIMIMMKENSLTSSNVIFLLCTSFKFI